MPSLEELEGYTELVVGARYPLVVKVRTPAAGANWSLTVPGGKRWWIDTLSYRLTTSAVVANRLSAVTVTDGTTEVWRGGPLAQFGASTAHYICGADGFTGNTGTAFVLASPFQTPRFWLEAGYVIAVVTYLLDAADQYNTINLLVTEARTGPPPPREARRAVAIDH